MKRTGILFVVLLLLSNTIFAQSNQGYETLKIELDTMFSKMELNRVPTHLLLDKAIEYANIRKYNGEILCDSTLVNKNTFIDIIKTINSCSTTNSPLINEDNLLSSFDNNNNNGKIQIFTTLFRYNYIKYNAIDDNLLSYNDKYVYDKYDSNGVWLNPYNTDIVFAMAPTSTLSRESVVEYKIINNNLFRNTVITKLYFDADDGNGYRLINPINDSTIPIIYTNNGIKHIKLKAILNNGHTLVTHSKVYIKKTLQVSKTDQSGDQIKMEPISELTTICDNKVGVYYYSAHGDRSIRKPFIIAEGFDPWQLINYTGHIIKEGFTAENGFTTYYEIAKLYYDSSLKDNGYDLVYIDWYDSYADIKENAEYLIMIIDYINEQKASVNSTETNILMGQSMGGLIARYALRKMEKENKPHQVTTYVSHDSPHLGANVPLGAQYFIHQLISLSHNYNTVMWAANLLLNNQISDIERVILNTLHSQSAKQMLINYVDQSGQLNANYHTQWQDELKAIGFPQGDKDVGIDNIAIINGDVFDLSDVIKDTEDHLFAVYADASTSFATSLIGRLGYLFGLHYIALLLDLDTLFYAMYIPGNSNIKVTAEVNPFTASSLYESLSKLKITYTKHILWIKGWTRTINIYNSNILAPSYGMGCDDYYGSIYCLTSEDKDKDENEDDNDKNDSPDKSGWAGTYNIDTMLVDRIMFIPTTSALAMGDHLSDYDNKKDYRSYPPIPDIETPFNSYYFVNNDDYKVHIHLNKDVFDWIYKQANIRIDGPDIVTDSATYTYECPEGTNELEWKSSNNSIASIDDNGVLTVHRSGVVTIELTTQYNGYELVRKTKKVVTGYPELYVNKQYDMRDGYTLTAHVADQYYADEIQKMVMSGKLKYEWTIINEIGARTTFTTGSDMIQYVINEDEVITIAVRLKYGDNYLSKTAKFITLNLQTPFELNYKYVVVSGQKRIYYIKSDGTYDIDYPSEDLSIRFRNLLLDSNDNIMTLVSQYIGKNGNTCSILYNNDINGTYDTMTGTKVFGEYKWYFPFFESLIFQKDLTDAINTSDNSSIIIGDYDMRILNSDGTKVQNTPFAVIYKPTFQEYLTIK